MNEDGQIAYFNIVPCVDFFSRGLHTRALARLSCLVLWQQNRTLQHCSGR